MKSITNAAELTQAIAAESAVIFLWVDWSIQARQSEAVILKAVQAVPAEARPNLYKVDVSSEEGELSKELREWLHQAGREHISLITAGAGSLLLCKAGRLVKSIVFPAAYRYQSGITPRELIDTLIALQASL
jgi:hypothetical protein